MHLNSRMLGGADKQLSPTPPMMLSRAAARSFWHAPHLHCQVAGHERMAIYQMPRAATMGRLLQLSHVAYHDNDDEVACQPKMQMESAWKVCSFEQQP